MKSRIIILAALAAALTVSSCAYRAPKFPFPAAKPAHKVETLASAGAIHEYQFSNGLKLLVKEDHRAPVVNSQVWYKVGSSYEHDGITGVSHALEHMMFQGSAKHPPGEFSKIIAENGGSENAFTGQDYTAYFQTLDKNRLEISFELESDRMRNLLLKQEEFAKEIRIVMEERRWRTDDKPESVTYERLTAAAFLSSPYRIPVIGWMNDLENLKLDDLQAWYQTWYAPNNATLVVVGDVRPEEVKQLAAKYFGDLKPSVIKPLKPRKEVEALGARHIEVRVPAEVPVLYLGFPVPSLAVAVHPSEAYALEVLANVLDGGSSARIPRELIRGEQIATNAGAGYSLTSRVSDLFILTGTPATGKSIRQLQSALLGQVERLKKELVPVAELDKIKSQVVASAVYQQDSNFYQAMQLGTYETIGLSWKDSEDYVNRIKAVTPQQIQQVAKKYFLADHLVSAELVPLPLDPNKKPSAPPVGGRHK